MGLPLFVVPVEPDTTSKATEKSASQARSMIRRQRTVRGSDSRRRRWLGMFMDSNSGDQAAENGRRSPSSEYPPTVLPPRMLHHVNSDEREVVSFERQRTGTLLDGAFMPPVPESRDYPSVYQREREAEQHSRQPLQSRSRDWAAEQAHPRVRITASSRAAMNPEEAAALSEPSPPRRINDDDNQAAQPSSLSYQSREDLQLNHARRLAQLARHTRVAYRRARPDGLGDRDRSLSSGDGGAWDTLLTGITPDPQPPSAGSSFASSSAVAAIASSSASPNPPSASTSITSPDRSEESLTPRDCDMSDHDSSPEGGDGNEYGLDPVPYLENMPVPELRRGGMRGPNGLIRWRTYSDAATAREGRDRRRSGSGRAETDHLDSMHRIISGLAVRDDIPDTWWAQAGLRREPST